MKHQIKGYKLGRDTKHRKSLGCNLASSLILYGKIKTTHTKAKFLVPYVSKLITLGKRDGLHNYRRLLSLLRGKEVVAKKVLEYAKSYKDRNGGYVSINKIGQRLGDAAPISLVRLM